MNSPWAKFGCVDFTLAKPLMPEGFPQSTSSQHGGGSLVCGMMTSKMETGTELASVVVAIESGRKGNRGWFAAGDPRINRSGRPKRQVEVEQGVPAAKPVSGPIMTLFVPESDLRSYIAGRAAPWVVNLPHDFRIVGVDLDSRRAGFVLTIRSPYFAIVEAGAPIPEIRPSYHGLKWRT
jgi:hypothetical protein